VRTKHVLNEIVQQLEQNSDHLGEKLCKKVKAFYYITRVLPKAYREVDTEKIFAVLAILDLVIDHVGNPKPFLRSALTVNLIENLVTICGDEDERIFKKGVDLIHRILKLSAEEGKIDLFKNKFLSSEFCPAFLTMNLHENPHIDQDTRSLLSNIEEIITGP
jgi:hypothetical protein